jgi:hypothetical protein
MSTGAASPDDQLSIKYTAENTLAAEEHNVVGFNWSRNNSVNRLQRLLYGLDNRIIGVRFQTMVDFYQLQSTGMGSLFNPYQGPSPQAKSGQGGKVRPYCQNYQ